MKKINSNKKRHLIVKNELEKLQTSDSIYFRGESHFEDDATQNCLVFQTKTMSTNNDHISPRKSKGFSYESIKPPSASTNIFSPSLNYVGTKIWLELKGSCLKQDKISFDHGKVVNIYIVSEINKNFTISSFPTLENCLFGVVKLTKHIDIDNYKYSAYGIRFDRKGFFSLGNEVGKNVIIFGVDMSSCSCPYIDNKKKRFFNSWQRSYTMIRTKTDYRKIVFNHLYYKKYKILFNLLGPVGWGGSFLPTANLNLNYFWTASGMNLKLYDFF